MKLAPSELVWDACLSTWLHTPDRPMVPNQPINQNMVSSSLSNVQFDVLIANDYFTPPPWLHVRHVYVFRLFHGGFLLYT